MHTPRAYYIAASSVLPAVPGVAVFVLNGDAVDGKGGAILKSGFHPVGVHVVAAGKQFHHSSILLDLILVCDHSNQCRQVGGGIERF